MNGSESGFESPETKKESILFELKNIATDLGLPDSSSMIALERQMSESQEQEFFRVLTLWQEAAERGVNTMARGGETQARGVVALTIMKACRCLERNYIDECYDNLRVAAQFANQLHSLGPEVLERIIELRDIMYEY